MRAHLRRGYGKIPGIGIQMLPQSPNSPDSIHIDHFLFENMKDGLVEKF